MSFSLEKDLKRKILINSPYNRALFESILKNQVVLRDKLLAVY